MATHPELRLISKTVTSAEFRAVVRAGLKEEHFTLPEAKAMYRAVRRYYFNHRHPGAVPTRRWMRERFPAFRALKHGRESIDELCEEVRRTTMSQRLLTIADELGDAALDDPFRAVNQVSAELRRIQTLNAQCHDRLLSDTADELWEEYVLGEQATTVQGLPWPWKEVTRMLSHILDEQFIVFYARNKSMKSFILAYLAAYYYHYMNRRVLFWSAEMPTRLIEGRILAAMCFIDYRAYKEKTLSPQDRTVLRDMLVRVKMDALASRRGNRGRGLLVTKELSGSRGSGSITSILAKAEEFDPDIIFVDSFYRLSDDASGRTDLDWKVIGNIARDLKGLAERCKVPLIGSTQASKKALLKGTSEGLEDLAYADVIGAECDLGLRIIKGQRTPEGRQLKIVASGAREVESGGFQLLCSPYTHMEFDGWIEEEVEDVDVGTVRRVKKSEANRICSREVDSTKQMLRSL